MNIKMCVFFNIWRKGERGNLVERESNKKLYGRVKFWFWLLNELLFYVLFRRFVKVSKYVLFVIGII